MEKEREFELLAQLEQETTKLRYTTFGAILSISFLLPGLSAFSPSEMKPIYILRAVVTLREFVFLLGFVFYVFSVFHYVWYHRYSHIYRARLKAIEQDLGIAIYRLRVRPTLGPFKLHFHWGLIIIGLVYGYITGTIVGWSIFALFMVAIVITYSLLTLYSYWQPLEPLE